MAERYHEHPVDTDGWTEWILPRQDYRLRCCDCRLVHDVEFRVADGMVWWRVRRNERATAASRRKQEGSMKVIKNSYWFRQHPLPLVKDGEDEYEIGIATSEEGADLYVDSGFRRITREDACAHLRRRTTAEMIVRCVVTINRKTPPAGYDRFSLAHALKRGKPLPARGLMKEMVTCHAAAKEGL